MSLPNSCSYRTELRLKKIFTSNSKPEKKVYFIICEGTKTEIKYFEGLIGRRKELKISSNIELKIIKQEKSNNPLKLFEQIVSCKKSGEIDLNEDIDEIYLIVDRDPENFTPEQFDEVTKRCGTEKINLAISNKCFELWLLLHFNDCKKYDKVKLEFNPIESNEHTYISRMISEEIKKIKPKGCYKKTSLNFDFFSNKIKNAIKNAKKFETENLKLKTKLGTSVGIFVEKLLNDKS